jgi:SNF2 family DNA or RNA helicase
MFVLPEKNAIIVPDLIEGRPFTVLPYCLQSYQYLASKGINLPSMIRTEYGFKSQYPKPYAHQVETADFLVQHQRAGVFSEIGTGKSLPILWAYDFLRRKGMAGKMLIVSTLSTLDVVWAREIFKSFPHLTCRVLHGSKARRLKMLSEDVDVYIINHEGLVVMSDWAKGDSRRVTGSAFDKVVGLTHIAVDESTMVKNQRTDRYRALSYLAAKTKNIWLMSGSPMPKAPTDIWAQARLIDTEIFSKSFVRFRDQVMVQNGMFNWLPKTGWQEYVYGKLKNHCIRFERKTCLDLPPCVTKMRRVEMTTEQAKHYKDMKEKCIVEMREGKITAANEGVKLGKLLQISCGLAYVEGHSAEAINSKTKLKELDSIIESVGSKVIIFTPYKFSCKLLSDHLQKAGSVKVINGDVPKSKRTGIFDDFQYGDLDFIVAHPEAMAHGINLTRSHTIIWWSPVDNFGTDEQASGRITRGGQNQIQTIWRLSCSPAEDKVYKRLLSKESMQGLLMDLLKN